MIKKFFFTPVVIHRKPKSSPKDKYPYIKIFKSGLMDMHQNTLNWLVGKETESFFLRFYEDKLHRALGFKIFKSINKDEYKEEDGYRFVKIKNYNGTRQIGISIKSFLWDLKDVNLPSKKLPIRKYKDQDSYAGVGELYYIKIPKGDELPDDRIYDASILDYAGQKE
jgi:hypothetical protein